MSKAPTHSSAQLTSQLSREEEQNRTVLPLRVKVTQVRVEQREREMARNSERGKEVKKKNEGRKELNVDESTFAAVKLELW